MSTILAMILAGGVGKRLSILSQLRAKPAVPFGGIYRIIDFTLSNVMNSEIGHVAVLPQYRPLSLVDHIGMGAPWDFNGRTRRINILSPSTGKKDSDWYHGTADAVRQNLDYVRNFGSKYLLLLSGDHIYRMNYNDMLAYHQEHKADVTVAMIRVPLSETSEFGIGMLNSEGRIIDWAEKPETPKSDLASMGMYVFSTDFLFDQLQKIPGDDFGHDLIPQSIADHNAFGYVFDGYWRDVGTLKAYWESNMEVFQDESKVDLKDWNVATNFDEEKRVGDRPPAFISQTAMVENSLIAQGCVIEGIVENSVLSPGVHVGPGAVVRNSIIFHDTTVGAGSKLDYCIIDKGVGIGQACRLGDENAGPDHLCLIGKRAIVPDAMKIGKFCKVYPLSDLNKHPSRVAEDFQEIGTPLL